LNAISSNLEVVSRKITTIGEVVARGA
jgi:hypothetical protein